MRYFQALVVVQVTISLTQGFARAQSASDYPNKPVRVVVASATGGGSDISTRLLTQKLSESLNRPFVVENRAGGGNTIGYAFVAKSAPDGYTLLSTAPSFTFALALRPDLPYDPIRDFVAISLVVKSPYLLVVHPALPVRSVKELIALARSKPGALDMAVSYGAFTHLAAAYFASAAKINVTLVPYKGGSQDTVDVIAGQVHMLLGSILSNMPHVRAGKLRALAVSTTQRSRMLPELPSISEAGIPFDVSSWLGLLAPAGTSSPIVGKLSAEIAKAVKSPEVAQNFAHDGAEAIGSTPEEFRKLIVEEVPRWSKIVKDTGMQVQ